MAEDTHLHASLQRTFETVEVALAHECRKQEPDKTPKFSRQDIVDIVRQAWLSQNHAGLSATGYRQLGQTLPMDGSADEELFRDLKPWWDRISGSDWRAQCTRQVESMWEAGIVRGWADANTLVEDHAPHAPIEEGDEHRPWDVVDEQDTVGGSVPDLAEEEEGEDVDQALSGEEEVDQALSGAMDQGSSTQTAVSSAGKTVFTARIPTLFWGFWSLFVHTYVLKVASSPHTYVHNIPKVALSPHAILVRAFQRCLCPHR